MEEPRLALLWKSLTRNRWVARPIPAVCVEVVRPPGKLWSIIVFGNAFLVRERYELLEEAQIVAEKVVNKVIRDLVRKMKTGEKGLLLYPNGNPSKSPPKGDAFLYNVGGRLTLRDKRGTVRLRKNETLVSALARMGRQ